MLKRLMYAQGLPLALLLIPVGALAAGAARAEPSAAVELTFQVGEPKGAVLVALYDSEAGYAARRQVRSLAVPSEGSKVTARFEGLAPGRYAAQAFHDLNGDGRMNTNMVGLPTEPFAFSNNAPARGGPAPWSAAAFEVGPQGAAQTIAIR